MANYQQAFDKMIRNEDGSLSGIVQTDNDGGKVRFGLNSNAHPALLAANFYTVNRTEALLRAQLYYHEWYWEPVKGDLIKDQNVANKVFDQCVPMGINEACKLTQRALNSMGADPTLEEDGVLGPLSIEALNKVDPTAFITAFITTCKNFYDELATEHPEWAHLLPGWLGRVEKV